MTSICGMAVATAAIICVLSVFNGFRAVIAGRLDTLSPDVLVTPAKGKTIADGEEAAARILAVEGVERATPTISDNALALYGGREMPVLLKGVDPEAYSEITSVRSLIIPDHSGRFLKNGAAKAEGTLSIGVASQLGVFPGDGFLIFAPRREGRVNLANPLASFITDSITASGVFRTDQTEYDTDHLIVDLATARRLFSYDRQASAIEVKTREGADPAAVAGHISEKIGTDYIVKDRMRQQEMNFRMIEMGIVSSALLHTDHSLVQHHLVAFHACPRKAVVTIDTLRHGHEQASDRKSLFLGKHLRLADGRNFGNRNRHHIGISSGAVRPYKDSGRRSHHRLSRGARVERRGNHSHPRGRHRFCHCCHHRRLRPLAHKLTRQSINSSTR